MNIKVALISFFITIHAAEKNEIVGQMTAREQAILTCMERRVSIPPHTKDRNRLKASIKSTYLLSHANWHELGSESFMQAMSKHVRCFDRVLAFQQFMEDKVPKKPSVKVISSEGNRYSVQYFHNDYYSYVMSEHTCLPDRVIIQEFNTWTVICLERYEVYPEMIVGD